MFPSPPAFDALVVLGCRSSGGLPGPALKRRLEHAAGVFESCPVPVLFCGGKRWDGEAEAETMQRAWVDLVHREGRVLLELESLTTRQNARYAAAILRSQGFSRAGLVTCDFHMRRARRHFERQGIEVVELPAPSDLGGLEWLRQSLRELGAHLLEPFDRR